MPPLPPATAPTVSKLVTEQLGRTFGNAKNTSHQLIRDVRTSFSPPGGRSITNIRDHFQKTPSGVIGSTQYNAIKTVVSSKQSFQGFWNRRWEGMKSYWNTMKGGYQSSGNLPPGYGASTRGNSPFI